MLTTEEILHNRYQDKIKSINKALMTNKTLSFEAYTNFYLDYQRCVYAKCNENDLLEFANYLINAEVIVFNDAKKAEIAEIKSTLKSSLEKAKTL